MIQTALPDIIRDLTEHLLSWVGLNRAAKCHKCLLVKDRRRRHCCAGAGPWLQSHVEESIYTLNHMDVCMYACMHAGRQAAHVCLSVCLHVGLHVCLHVCLYVCPSGCLSAWLPGCLSACLSVCPSVRPLFGQELDLDLKREGETIVR